MQWDEYRKLQIARLTNLSGCHPLEMMLITNMFQTALSYINFILDKSARFDWGALSQKSRFCLESMSIVGLYVVIILYPIFVLPIYFLMAFSWLVITFFSKTEQQTSVGLRINKKELSVPRASIFFQTYLSIFAVDFPLYPLKFAKTETAGISLMDIGVGCYIGINAVNAAYRNLRHSTGSSVKPTSRIWIRVGPMLLLGVLRMLFVKMLGYPEHVSEYGVHWNFFISLAIIAIIVDRFGRYTFLTPNEFTGIGMALIFLYEFVVHFFNLSNVILSNERPRHLESLYDFILMNKEGYTSIYLIVYGASTSKHRFEWAMLFLFLYLFCDKFIGIVSRRIGNSAFVFWTLFFLFFQTSLSNFLNARGSVFHWKSRDAKSSVQENYIETTKLAEKCSKDRSIEKKESEGYKIEFGDVLVDTLNSCPLLTFLISNLLTGLVNMTIQSLFLSSLVSVFFIFSYGCIILSTAYLVTTVYPSIAM